MEPLKKDAPPVQSFFKQAALTWLAVLAFLVVIPLLIRFEFSLGAGIAILALIGGAFFGAGYRSRETRSENHSDSPQLQPGLRSEISKHTRFEELEMDDQIATLNNRRLK